MRNIERMLFLHEKILECREFCFGYFDCNRLGFIFEYESDDCIGFRRIEIETSCREILCLIERVYLLSECFRILQECIITHGTRYDFHTQFFIFIGGILCVGIERIESKYSIILDERECRGRHDLRKEFS